MKKNKQSVINTQQNMQHDDMNEDVILRLTIAIIKRAREDYIKGTYKERKDVELFMRSEYYSTLTNMKNGEDALLAWESVRHKLLGEGDIVCNDRIFLVEGVFPHDSKDVSYYESILISAKNKSDMKNKIREMKLRKDLEYQIYELHGVNKKVYNQISKSNGIIILKKERF